MTIKAQLEILGVPIPGTKRTVGVGKSRQLIDMFGVRYLDVVSEDAVMYGREVTDLRSGWPNATRREDTELRGGLAINAARIKSGWLMDILPIRTRYMHEDTKVKQSGESHLPSRSRR